jgi:hypothetical protein
MGRRLLVRQLAFQEPTKGLLAIAVRVAHNHDPAAADVGRFMPGFIVIGRPAIMPSRGRSAGVWGA